MPPHPRSTFDADAKPALGIGQRIDRYVLQHKLGAGAMGTVYEALDDKLGRRVALKVLHGDLRMKHHQRMQREALALARLSHPNVVHLYEIGLVEDRTFIAMELVPGERWTNGSGSDRLGASACRSTSKQAMAWQRHTQLG